MTGTVIFISPGAKVTSIRIIVFWLKVRTGLEVLRLSIMFVIFVVRHIAFYYFLLIVDFAHIGDDLGSISCFPNACTELISDSYYSMSFSE